MWRFARRDGATLLGIPLPRMGLPVNLRLAIDYLDFNRSRFMKILNFIRMTLYAVSVFFIGMSIFADKATTSGMIISLIGYGSLFIASCISLITLILQKKRM